MKKLRKDQGRQQSCNHETGSVSMKQSDRTNNLQLQFEKQLSSYRILMLSLGDRQERILIESDDIYVLRLQLFVLPQFPEGRDARAELSRVACLENAMCQGIESPGIQFAFHWPFLQWNDFTRRT
jgi:hypothetical protein